MNNRKNNNGIVELICSKKDLCGMDGTCNEFKIAGALICCPHLNLGLNGRVEVHDLLKAAKQETQKSGISLPPEWRSFPDVGFKYALEVALNPESQLTELELAIPSLIRAEIPMNDCLTALTDVIQKGNKTAAMLAARLVLEPIRTESELRKDANTAIMDVLGEMFGPNYEIVDIGGGTLIGVRKTIDTEDTEH